MSFRFRIVPKRKRRGIKSFNTRKPTPAWSRNQSLDSLAKGKCFGDLPHEVYSVLNEISSPMTCPEGAILFVQGQNPQGVYIIAQGQVKLSACSADGKSLTVGKAGPGNLLGLPSVVSGKPNELTAEAMDSVQCSVIDRGVFLQFLREHGVAALRVAEIVSDMYVAAFDQARYLGLSSTATEKLARLILDLPCAGAEAVADTRDFSATHREIGEMIGTSRETVTRLFTRFRKEQLVHVDNSRLHILDRQGLEQLLTG